MALATGALGIKPSRSGAQVDTGSGSSVAAGTDVNLITGAETFPRITQSESAIWSHGSTIVVAYTDSSGGGLSPISFCGVSVATDGGTTFSRLPYKFNEGGECYAKPSVFYSVRAAKWFISFLTNRCGAMGIGRWESIDGFAWSNSGCVATSTSADSPKSWVNNDPHSPYFGRQHLIYTDFAENGALRHTFSTDDGVTWSTPTVHSSTLRRALGVVGADTRIFIMGMDEGGGGLNTTRTHYFIRSSDGGQTFAAPTALASALFGPGRTACGDDPYFACIYTSPNGGYWRDMGWGQLAAGPDGVLHYVYSARNGPTDSHIYYIRSFNGVSWSTPVILDNSFTLGRQKWSPSIAVSSHGRLFASWYDERNTTDDSLQRFGAASFDNGTSWVNQAAISDVIFPKPLQPDMAVSPSFAGTYDYATTSDDGYETYHAWTDGRVSSNGQSQQDVFFDKIAFVTSPLIVTTTADHDDGVCDASDCTLREAIAAANATPFTYDRIRFALGVAGTIQLAGALPAMSTEIGLEGPGAGV